MRISDKNHWSNIPDLKNKTKEIFNSLSPDTWKRYGYDSKLNSVEVTLDIADVHIIISEILRKLHNYENN